MSLFPTDRGVYQGLDYPAHRIIDRNGLNVPEGDKCGDILKAGLREGGQARRDVDLLVCTRPHCAVYSLCDVYYGCAGDPWIELHVRREGWGA